MPTLMGTLSYGLPLIFLDFQTDHPKHRTTMFLISTGTPAWVTGRSLSPFPTFLYPPHGAQTG